MHFEFMIVQRLYAKGYEKARQKTLLKMLNRIHQLQETKESVSKILSVVFMRKLKVKQLIESIQSRKINPKLYVDILKVSAKLLKMIDDCMKDDPAMCRDFVFAGQRYDEQKCGFMYHQIKKMREKILKVKDCPECDYILLPTGLIGHISEDMQQQ